MASSSAPHCPICLKSVSDDSDRTVVTLRCSHVFHLDCIGSAFNASGAMLCPVCDAIENGTWRWHAVPIAEQNLAAENQDQNHLQEPSPMDPQLIPLQLPNSLPSNMSRYHAIQHFIVEVNKSSTEPRAQGEQEPVAPDNANGTSVPTDTPFLSYGNDSFLPTETPILEELCDDCFNKHRSATSGHSGNNNGISLASSTWEINCIPLEPVTNPILNDTGIPAYTSFQGIVYVHHYHVNHPYQQQAAQPVLEDQVVPESEGSGGMIFFALNFKYSKTIYKFLLIFLQRGQFVSS